MEYFTSEAYERGLDEEYKKQITKKQAEIDEIQRRTKEIQKYTAYGYISKQDRVFYVEEDGKVYYGEVKPENECPNKLVSGGKKYILDSNFELYIMEFKNKHKRYIIKFMVDGKYGPCGCYCSSIGALPAIMESYDGDILNVEDESKYDICVS